MCCHGPNAPHVLPTRRSIVGAYGIGCVHGGPENIREAMQSFFLVMEYIKVCVCVCVCVCEHSQPLASMPLVHAGV